MHLYTNAFLLICFTLFVPLTATERGSSAPYISGDTFRAHCRFVFDEDHAKLPVKKIKQGDTIFVKVDYLETFFNKYHPRIEQPYILVTHNSDIGTPGKFAHYLDDPKLLAWFAQNVEETNHPKLHPIPIGMANKCWQHGNPKIMATVQKLSDKSERDILLYMNFREQTYRTERGYVNKLFDDASYCHYSPPKPYKDYLSDLTHSKFVLSPRGNGLDCHRTWESIWMGAIPIVRSSSLDKLFEDLPVLIIDEWSEINEEFLKRKYAEMKLIKYDLSKAYFNYWWSLIESAK